MRASILPQPVSSPNSSSPPVHNSPSSMIQQYILQNLTDPQHHTLKPGVVSMEYMSNSTYIGQVNQQNQKQGMGVYKYSNKDIYMGDWQKGHFNGLGMYIFQNGDVYVGVFVEGRSTRGKHLSRAGHYQGDFDNGMKQGNGQWVSQNQKETYKGQWNKDQRHGVGQYQNNNYFIKGEWEDDQPNGEVIIKSTSIDYPKFQFNGIMSNSQLVSGNMKINYSETQNYEGNVYKQNIQGHGKYSFVHQQDGQIQYEGTFKDNSIVHSGTFTRRPFFNNQISLIKGVRFEGAIDGKGLPKGHGKMVYQNGDTYQGNFERGLRNGQGVYRYRNGDQYEGTFFNDLIDGNGSYTFANGHKIFGLFSQGRLIQNNTSSNLQPLNTQQSHTSNNQPIRNSSLNRKPINIPPVFTQPIQQPKNKKQLTSVKSTHQFHNTSATNSPAESPTSRTTTQNSHNTHKRHLSNNLSLLVQPRVHKSTHYPHLQIWK